jgi:uncharacterized membrane protein (DUF4010 family)
VRESGGAFAEAAYRGIVLSTAAMLLRNAVILGALAPAALLAAALPLTLMFVVAAGAALRRAGPASAAATGTDEPLPSLTSPFSPFAALQFGLLFLALQVAGDLAQRMLGYAGLLAVSAVGGLVSSASAVGAAANAAATHASPPHVAGWATVIASLMSACVTLPIVARVASNRALVRRVSLVLGLAAVAGAAGAAIQLAASAW